MAKRTVHKFLKFLKTKQLTKTTLAALMEITKHGIDNWLTSDAMPNVENEIKLCRILDIKRSKLIKLLEKKRGRHE